MPLVSLHVEGVGVTTQPTILEMEGRKEESMCVCVRGDILNKQISFHMSHGIIIIIHFLIIGIQGIQKYLFSKSLKKHSIFTSHKFIN